MLNVLRAGLETTVQDLGRSGWARFGIPRGGAMDPEALALANRLVGNPPGAAGLELLGGGLLLRTEVEIAVARAGARAAARIGRRSFPAGRAVTWQPDELLEIDRLRDGMRAWLAFAGGIALPPVLGSRSTLVRARLGGLEGRALRAGDRLPLAAVPQNAPEPTPVQELPRIRRNPLEIRVLPGAHFDRFPERSRAALAAELWRVTMRSDRMGLRLDGTPIAAPGGELRSEATLPGSVQVPPDGLPIVLGPDHPTTGGYPRLAQVVRADLGTLAWLRPGDPARFRWCTVDEARRALEDLKLLYHP